MELFVGTSGYAYKEWKGVFYPEKLPQKEMLAYYGERFSSCEINNTFYRMPSESVLATWSKTVPDHFRFILKASRRITHFKRLNDTEEELGYFLKTSTTLGAKLGPTLFQLPPNFKKDLDKLEQFLKSLPKRWRAAFEFRHDSWFDDDVISLLDSHNVALVSVETEETMDVPFHPTTSWGYIRLRKMVYEDSELNAWIERIKTQDWTEAFVFFKHEDAGTGPKLARRFQKVWETHAK